MNKYLQALEKIKNEYDAYYFANKYGDGTHKEEFDLIGSILQNDLDKRALDWIRFCYDAYYKNKLDDTSAFAHLEKVLKGVDEK